MTGLQCQPNPTLGIARLSASDLPNGKALLTRDSPGVKNAAVRGGALTITTGGFVLDDAEAPLGVPLTYRLTMTGLTLADRHIQSNLVPTPTFIHGAQGWLPGDNRTMNVVTDVTAHTPLVQHFSGNTTGTAPSPSPVLVGHLNSENLVDGAYTMTAPTTGTGATVAGDWMFLFHQQLSSAAAPGLPVGFELVWSALSGPLSAYIWRRKRSSGDTGYTVPAAAGAASLGTLLWVRGVSDLDPVLVGETAIASGVNAISVPTVTRPRPSLSLTFSAGLVVENADPPGLLSVSGSIWQYTQGSGTDPRNTTVASWSTTNAGVVPPTTVGYQAQLDTAIAVQIGIQAFAPTAPRIIAKAKTTLMKADPHPYLVTGRFKFKTSDLFTWQDVMNNNADWAAVRAQGSWGTVRGASAGVGGDYIRMFVSIANPATGNYYVEPVQILTLNAGQMGSWLDFSFYFTTPVDIPATAEIRFLHGTNFREYAVEWWLDEIGITPPNDLIDHATVYWFDGDSTPPPNSEDYLFENGSWDAITHDAFMSWAGTPGNSISNFYGPSGISGVTHCQLDPPESAVCQPVLLNDPVSPQRSQWFSLIGVDPLSYAARQTLYDVINRAAQTAVSQVREWASGSLELLTYTFAERDMALRVFAPGRILLLRNPDPAYPESNWFIAIGDVLENRVGPDARRPERDWTVPFARVERPSGLIDSQTGVHWDAVKANYPNWLGVRGVNEDWLEVLTSKVGAI